VILVAVVVWRLQTSAPVKDQSVTVSKTEPTAVVEPATSRPVATAAPQSPAREEPAKTPAPAASVKQSVEDKLRDAGLLRPPDSDGAGVVVEDVGADGKVRLVGVLKDRAARQAAAELVRSVAGVTAVDVGRVTVQTGWSSK
jgi:hypothetical protein